jgi:hypothetical protein
MKLKSDIVIGLSFVGLFLLALMPGLGAPLLGSLDLLLLIGRRRAKQALRH